MRKPRGGIDWKQAFLSALADTGLVTVACRRAKVGRATAYEHRQRNPQFAEAWDQSIERAADLAQLEMRRRAIQGVPEPVFYRGKIVGHIVRYSDSLLLALLKALRPEVFGDQRCANCPQRGNTPVWRKEP